ncbi:hypothetical protein Sm713_13500 [Streptomyces sp. TS71-3]|nr:hypothetical protein Sm713_13500 [Streptomyces sp. TS71-3]
MGYLTLRPLSLPSTPREVIGVIGMAGDRVQWTFPANAGDVRSARARIRGRLGNRRAEPLADLAELLVSALVSRSLRHTGGPVGALRVCPSACPGAAAGGGLRHSPHPAPASGRPPPATGKGEDRGSWRAPPAAGSSGTAVWTKPCGSSRPRPVRRQDDAGPTAGESWDRAVIVNTVSDGLGVLDTSDSRTLRLVRDAVSWRGRFA